jgi:hypothetical protein
MKNIGKKSPKSEPEFDAEQNISNMETIQTLARRGLVFDSGRRRLEGSGRYGIVWVADRFR